MCQTGSENLDFDAKGSGYVALMELAKDSVWSSRPLTNSPPPPPPPPGPPPPQKQCQHCCKAGCGVKCCSAPPPAKQGCCCVARDGPVCPPGPPPPPPVKVMSVAEAAAEWALFFTNKLGDMALSGLFSELGSPNYWYRTYPAIINLADFGSPRVRQRARMFLDLAMVDSEQLTIGGFRAGAKMRAKKVNHQPAFSNVTLIHFGRMAVTILLGATVQMTLLWHTRVGWADVLATRSSPSYAGRSPTLVSFS